MYTTEDGILNILRSRGRVRVCKVFDRIKKKNKVYRPCHGRGDTFGKDTKCRYFLSVKESYNA